MDVFFERQCSSMEEFFEWLNVPKFQGRTSPGVIFRGQGDSSWKLLPSIHRGTKKKRQQTPANRLVQQDCASIAEFIEFCDMARLPIPGDSAVFRESFNRENCRRSYCDKPEAWPPKESYDVLSVMQHFAYPTCLLDWTTSPMVAAYFAAKEAITNRRIATRIKDRRLAIWQLNESCLSDYARQQAYREGLEELRLFERVRIPPNNRNIYAQAGTFTLVRQRVNENGYFTGPFCLEQYIKTIPPISSNNYFLEKITISARFAVAIIERACGYGINTATIFPDYTGVAEEMKFQPILKQFIEMNRELLYDII